MFCSVGDGDGERPRMDVPAVERGRGERPVGDEAAEVEEPVVVVGGGASCPVSVEKVDVMDASDAIEERFAWPRAVAAAEGGGPLLRNSEKPVEGVDGDRDASDGDAAAAVAMVNPLISCGSCYRCRRPPGLWTCNKRGVRRVLRTGGCRRVVVVAGRMQSNGSGEGIEGRGRRVCFVKSVWCVVCGACVRVCMRVPG